ncbi:MAG: ATP-binding cassette domain-containing protein [Candidatus Methylacidiphilales bacterium]|nr:ATP-binding cassette domain-containing protein [Candidatus Methylacidiphilales bacterium]
MIRYDNVSKHYAGTRRPALAPLSINVERGKTLALLGSSGSGKSTLLKITNRLLETDTGTVWFDGKDSRNMAVEDLRKQCGHVMQRPGLLPHLSVEANVGLRLKLDGVDPEKIRTRSREMLAMVELPPEEYGRRTPRELSGGQQARVSFARAVAHDPPVILLDEPFGALDEVTRGLLQQAFLNWKREFNKTAILVTHDLFEALALADYIAVLHLGRLEQAGPPRELLDTPATDYVRELFARPARQLKELQQKGMGG